MDDQQYYGQNPQYPPQNVPQYPPQPQQQQPTGYMPQPTYQIPQPPQYLPPAPMTMSPEQQAAYQPSMGYDQFGNPVYSPPLPPPPPPPPQDKPNHNEAIPPEVVKLHQDSVKKYPKLNLSAAEYVILSVRRHPIGLFKIWFIGFIIIAAFIAMYVLLFMGSNSGASTQEFSPLVASLLVLMLIVVALGTMVASYVYSANRFFLTNESVIQEIHTTPFAQYEQTVSLSNIEDASYKQGGILETILNFGTIRLSTEGDDTIYRFTYVAAPKHQVAIINNAVEDFKNGAPFNLAYNDQPSFQHGKTLKH